MEGFQFIDIILLAMVAGFLILRLRSVLGRRTGHEQSPNENFQAARDNVVPLPSASRETEEEAVPTEIEPAYKDTPLEPGLISLRRAAPEFSSSEFLDGAAHAFELIVVAYAKGDVDTLKPLLSSSVYSNFASAIQDREDRAETMDTQLVSVRPAKLESVSMEGADAMVAVRFESEQVNVITDADGSVVEGSLDVTESVIDIWTFRRDTESRDPNWTLVATRSVE